MSKVIRKISIFRIIYLLIAVFIIYFACIPILSVVSSSFLVDNFRLDQSQWNDIISHLLRSMKVSIPVTIIVTIFGSIIAFTLKRIKFRGRSILRIVSLIPLINPPFVGSVSFIMLFGKRGLITHEILGLTRSPYGYTGIFVLQVLGLTSFAYILISSSLVRIDTSLEEAARNLGASSTRILKDITFPLMIPEIASAALLIFLASMADFTTPLIIGGSYQTLASYLYIQITGLYNLDMASISGFILLIPCLIVFFVHRYYVRRKKYFSEKNYSIEVEFKQLDSKIRNVFIMITMIFLLFVVTKYGFIIIGAFTNQWGYDYTFTFKHIISAISDDFSPFINSLKLAITVALSSSFLGVLLSYILKNKSVRLKGVIDLLGTLPAAVPGILFGIGYLLTFKHPFLGIGKYIFTESKPLILLGSGIIIFIICIARYLNIGLKAGYALLEHLDPHLEEASYNLGISEIKTFLKVSLPLLKPAFITAFFKNFTTTMTTLGAIIFLLIPSNKVAVQQIFQRITSSEIGVAAAMGVLLSATSLIFLGIFYIIFNSKRIIGGVKSDHKN
jgi:iron(III) transport system permease protein